MCVFCGDGMEPFDMDGYGLVIECPSCGRNLLMCKDADTYDDKCIGYKTGEQAEICKRCQYHVELRPVVHAHWICTDETFNVWRCSSCKEEWTLNDGTPKDENMHYCFNCGAIMDEESDCNG